MLRGSRRQEGQALKTARDRSGNLQGGPEEDAVEREVISVAADAPATPADAELGVEATLEHFRAAAPVVLEKIVAGLRQMDKQSRGGDADRRGLPGGVDSGQVPELFVPSPPVRVRDG